MKKSPLILIHGFRGAPSGLTIIANDLRAAGYDVYIPAIPPFAGATISTATYTPASYATFIANYIQEHHLRHPILIGHSMGSIVAAAAAAKHPELTSKNLILLSPISAPPSAFFQHLTPLSAHLPPRIIDYVTTRFLFVPHNRQLFQTTMEQTHRCSSTHPPKKSDLLRAARFSAKHSIQEFTPSLQDYRILLLAGAKDRLIPQATTNHLAKTLPNATTHYLSGTGHLHNYEQPHETAQAILQFLDAG